jgi:hypothetical protein
LVLASKHKTKRQLYQDSCYLETHYLAKAPLTGLINNNPMLGGITGHPVPGGYKYGDLAIQVGLG